MLFQFNHFLDLLIYCNCIQFIFHNVGIQLKWMCSDKTHLLIKWFLFSLQKSEFSIEKWNFVYYKSVVCASGWQLVSAANTLIFFYYVQFSETKFAQQRWRLKWLIVQLGRQFWINLFWCCRENKIITEILRHYI